MLPPIYRKFRLYIAAVSDCLRAAAHWGYFVYVFGGAVSSFNGEYSVSPFLSKTRGV